MADEKKVFVDYDVVSEIAGHQPNRHVELMMAAQDIFGKVKNNAMQCAVSGEFIEFDSVEELSSTLMNAVEAGRSVRVFDQNIGG